VVSDQSKVVSEAMNFAICARSCVSDRPDERGVIQTIGHQNASLGIRELIMTIAGGDTFSLNKAAESRFEDGCFYKEVCLRGDTRRTRETA